MHYPSIPDHELRVPTVTAFAAAALALAAAALALAAAALALAPAALATSLQLSSSWLLE